MRIPMTIAAMTAVALVTAACGSSDEQTAVTPAAVAGTTVAVRDTVMTDHVEIGGTAEPLQRATLSARLMSTVTAVLVNEGDRVAAGQVLVQLDARDITARREQVEAGLAAALAMQSEARSHATRIRNLFADSAATRSQLDQVETALARADAGVAQAMAMNSEAAVMASHATIRAPFAGTITARMVDPGALATPGSPLITIEDASSLRISAVAAPDLIGGIARGAKISATIGGTAVAATVEGVVPSGSNSWTINALVRNSNGELLSSAPARIAIPGGERRVVMIPRRALIERDGLTGVRVPDGAAGQLRWIRIGRVSGTMIEVLSGLNAGDNVLVGDGSL